MPSLVRHNANRWIDRLDAAGARVAVRPNPAKWSILEYACHVRDIFELYEHRLSLMLEQNGPTYPNWDQDITALEKNHRASDPKALAGTLHQTAEMLARRFESVDADDWPRTGFRSDGASFTVETFARYLKHGLLHHLWDIGDPIELSELS